jgi:adenine-specific DNA-methyltransferase
MSYRYLGNKSRLGNWIGSAIAERLSTGAKVADPMCGTAAVSAELAARGFSVVASDQLRFPVLHAQARLLFDGSFDFRPAASSYREAVDILNGLDGCKGFFWQEYSEAGSPRNGSRPRKYLTGENAALVDAIRLRIKRWREEGLNRRSADLLIHAARARRGTGSKFKMSGMAEKASSPAMPVARQVSQITGMG